MRKLTYKDDYIIGVIDTNEEGLFIDDTSMLMIDMVEGSHLSQYEIVNGVPVLVGGPSDKEDKIKASKWFLRNTLDDVLQYKEEIELGIPTTLTSAEYMQLLQDRLTARKYHKSNIKDK